MKTQTGRLVMAMAMLWIAFGAGVRAEAGGIALTTPAGLSPGDSFRFVFLTHGGTTATSTNISDYDAFVNAQAGGATYNGSVVTWLAIGSTSSVNAIDHIGQSPISGVYLADGTLVTPSTTSSGLWSGSLDTAITNDLSGPIGSVFTWTGTSSAGVATPFPLGNAGGVEIGEPPNTSGLWVDTGEAGNPSDSSTFQMYGISQVLTVGAAPAVPEPSSLVMAGTAILGVSALGWYRKRRDQRQRPVAPAYTTE